MKKIFLYGAPPVVPQTPEDSTKFLIERSGRNTGNLLIGYSVTQHLDGECVTMKQISDPKKIEDECYCVVIAAANFLHTGFDLGFMADFLEKIQLPCVVIGLGAQSNNYDITKIKLQEGTIRFVKIIAERSTSLGVRGYYTAQVLAYLGIYNVEVIGCPSFYLSCSPELIIKKKPFSDIKKIAINSSRRVTAHSAAPEKMRLAEIGLLKDAMNHDSDFIAQDEREEAILARKSPADMDTDEKSIFYPILAHYKDLNGEKVKSFFAQRSKVFFDVPSWEAQIRKYDFVCGTRFHGNLIALQNGIPATVIAHDSRTRELSELLGMPHVLVQDVQKMEDISIEKLYDLADFSRLHKSYSYLYKRYLSFLKANNLKHVLSFSQK
ncbi:hypothetical protein Tery_3237 [Trichodesmium erythraeum IMS101]|uniref:Polysaccharide pyruvyl transferase domain-containing protein n=1 Tax=Trichodesmium erythraeum (strain IMS101) TaxID=203124 RepID=Q10ZH2_TRIEI|nr:polysaccharide pyruvyl transferase family protein [Trichodesmium erythraeum GBRTRLIN201]